MFLTSSLDCVAVKELRANGYEVQVLKHADWTLPGDTLAVIRNSRKMWLMAHHRIYTEQRTWILGVEIKHYIEIPPDLLRDSSCRPLIEYMVGEWAKLRDAVKLRDESWVLV